MKRRINGASLLGVMKIEEIINYSMYNIYRIKGQDPRKSPKLKYNLENETLILEERESQRERAKSFFFFFSFFDFVRPISVLVPLFGVDVIVWRPMNGYRNYRIILRMKTK